MPKMFGRYQIELIITPVIVATKTARILIDTLLIA